jgi:hypothetical protein
MDITDDELIPPDETKILFLKIIEQAIRDYLNLARSEVPIEKEYFVTASGLLFDEDYRFMWGEYEIGLNALLAYINVDHEWFVRKVNLIADEYERKRQIRYQKQEI